MATRIEQALAKAKEEEQMLAEKALKFVRKKLDQIQQGGKIEVTTTWPYLGMISLPFFLSDTSKHWIIAQESRLYCKLSNMYWYYKTDVESWGK